MAQIPDLPLQPLEGESLPAIAPTPTDFGLGRAAGEAERVATMAKRTQMLGVRVQAAQDRQAVMTSPTFQNFLESDDRRFATEAGQWDTSQPGFAADQIGKTKAALADAAKTFAASGATPGQLGELNTLGLAAVAHRGAAANEYEQRQLTTQADQARETTTNGFLTQGIAAQGAAEQQIHDSYDGSTPTLVPQVSAAFDQAWGPVIASAPAGLQPRLQLEASARKAEAVARAGALQGEMQNAYIATQGNKQATGLINQIYSSPLAYDNAVGQFGAIAATLPAPIRAKATEEWQAAAVQARIGGLIDQRRPDQALAELNDGRYDSVLKPELKGELESRAIAANRSEGPGAIGMATANASAEQRLQADLESRAAHGKSILSPGEVNADYAAGILSADTVGRYNFAAQRADQQFAATGPVYGMSNAALAAAAGAPPPPPEDVPGNAAFQARQKAIAGEQAARREAGTWAWQSQGQTIGGQAMGPALQGKWTAATQAGPNQGAAMADYVGNMLGVQHQAGIAPAQMQILPQAQAAAIAASLTAAPPEGRLAAMQGIARLVASLPATSAAPDGTAVSPRALLARQLAKAGLTPIESSAIADFGDDPAKLGRIVAAENNSTLKGAAKNPSEGLRKGDPLPGLVRQTIAPFLASTAADADGPGLAQARTDRTLLVARQLESQGMSPSAAAAAAAQDLTGSYRFVDGWRMPASVAAAQTVLPPGNVAGVPFGLPRQVDGLAAARTGAGQLLSQLGANGGAGLYAPSTIAGAPDQRRAIFASQIARSGGWKTLPDDSGLALGVPGPDGSWRQVADRYGRPVQATWGQLQGLAQGQASPFAAPPANAVKTPAGQPVAAFSRSEGFSALSSSVEYQESRGINGRISPAGALGVMQLMPDTGARYAAQIGLHWDPDRALNDAAYNRQIGNAALGDLTGRFMTGANPSAGLGLALAAYNAGEGRLTGFTDKQGVYHRGWLQTIGDPRKGEISLNDFVSRIPIKETRDYVGQVLSRAIGQLHGAG